MGYRLLPSECGAAAILCVKKLDEARRQYVGATFVWWDSAAEAIEADRVLLDRPCSRDCVGVHMVLVQDGDRLKVRPSEHEATTTLEEELIACYGERGPERLLPPPRPEDNPPFYAADVLAEWRADDASQLATAVANPEMDDADRWLAEHEEAMAL